MVTFQTELKIIEWDVKPQTNEQTKLNVQFIGIFLLHNNYFFRYRHMGSCNTLMQQKIHQSSAMAHVTIFQKYFECF